MKTSRGFTLIELVVVLVIVALLISMAAAMTRGFSEATLRSTTAARLAAVDAALVNFVMVNRRLPCPADGALPSADANAGLESGGAGGCNNAQARGVVPWISLGLTETDAADGYSVRLSYRVTPDLALTEAMNFSTCDAGGSAAAGTTPSRCAPCASGGLNIPASCTPPGAAINGLGFEVRNLAGTPVAVPAINTGAAYVLWSHGANRGGGFGQGSGASQTATDAMDAGEIQNTGASALQAYYVDNEVTESPHFDDVVSRPLIFQVAMRAGLGPRVHTPS